jgi:hypothetical protein
MNTKMVFAVMFAALTVAATPAAAGESVSADTGSQIQLQDSLQQGGFLLQFISDCLQAMSDTGNAIISNI